MLLRVGLLLQVQVLLGGGPVAVLQLQMLLGGGPVGRDALLLWRTELLPLAPLPLHLAALVHHENTLLQLIASPVLQMAGKQHKQGQVNMRGAAFCNSITLERSMAEACPAAEPASAAQVYHCTSSSLHPTALP